MTTFLLSVAAIVAGGETSGTAFELRDGDRIALVGGSFVERMQKYGYLETALQSSAGKRSITIRNLGWSGDDVFGGARALFGNQEDGFQRLVTDVKAVKPTVVILCYGANEAHAGSEGLDAFKAGLSRLVDELAETGARFVFVSPPRYENLGPPLPDPAEFNQKLRFYRNLIESEAKTRSAHFVDLYDLTAGEEADDVDRLTDNGVHLTGYGYWRAAQSLVGALGGRLPEWRVELSAMANSLEAVGTTVSEVMPTALGLQFSCQDDSLPFPSPPKYSPASEAKPSPLRVLAIRDLIAGRHELLIDGTRVLTADHRQFASGVTLGGGPEFGQSEKLRRLIGEKNDLFFYRYRPQNETYLFLFRKHEQGNNAVEIPQFDSLVADREKEINRLRTPQKHTYMLRIIEAMNP